MQARGDLDQHLVAGRVAERVVDRAEAVQAEQQHRDARAQRPRERLLEALLEEQAVRQAGERVVQRLVGDALLQPAGLGDVGDRDHEARRLACSGW